MYESELRVWYVEVSYYVNSGTNVSTTFKLWGIHFILCLKIISLNISPYIRVIVIWSDVEYTCLLRFQTKDHCYVTILFTNILLCNHFRKNYDTRSGVTRFTYQRNLHFWCHVLQDSVSPGNRFFLQTNDHNAVRHISSNLIHWSVFWNKNHECEFISLWHVFFWSD